MADDKKTPEQELAEKQKIAYRNAMRRLRDENIEKFNDLRIAEAKKVGVEWTPKPTEEQRAAEQLAALIERYPHLAEQFRRGSTPGREDVGTAPPPDPEA